MSMNGTQRFKNVNICLNNSIYSYLETSGGKSYNLSLNVVHFFNMSINKLSVAASDICFRALLYNKRCPIASIDITSNLGVHNTFFLHNL